MGRGGLGKQFGASQRLSPTTGGVVGAKQLAAIGEHPARGGGDRRPARFRFSREFTPSGVGVRHPEVLLAADRGVQVPERAGGSLANGHEGVRAGGDGLCGTGLATKVAGHLPIDDARQIRLQRQQIDHAQSLVGVLLAPDAAAIEVPVNPEPRIAGGGDLQSLRREQDFSQAKPVRGDAQRGGAQTRAPVEHWGLACRRDRKGPIDSQNGGRNGRF